MIKKCAKSFKSVVRPFGNSVLVFQRPEFPIIRPMEVHVQKFVCACFAIPGQMNGTIDCDRISNCACCAAVAAAGARRAAESNAVERARARRRNAAAARGRRSSCKIAVDLGCVLVLPHLQLYIRYVYSYITTTQYTSAT